VYTDAQTPTFSTAALSELAILQLLFYTDADLKPNSYTMKLRTSPPTSVQASDFTPSKHFPMPMTVLGIDNLSMPKHLGSKHRGSPEDDQDEGDLESMLLSATSGKVDSSDSERDDEGVPVIRKRLSSSVDSLFEDIFETDTSINSNRRLQSGTVNQQAQTKYFIVCPRLLMPVKLFLRTIGKCKSCWYFMVYRINCM
jgi:tetrahydromethanopterin S-methyltransferase subunit F